MIRPAALLIGVLLAGCAAGSPGGDHCADAADQDPAYRHALAVSAGNPGWQWQHGEEMERMRRAAIDRCRNGGSGHRGGIEAPL